MMLLTLVRVFKVRMTVLMSILGVLAVSRAPPPLNTILFDSGRTGLIGIIERE